MGIFQKFMFAPRRSKPEIIFEEYKLDGRPDNDDNKQPIEKPSDSTVKEKAIVSFLYLLMVSFAVTLILYLIMSYIEHPKSNDALDIFKYVSSILVGYFVGANKER
jgi:hypothetical protein